MNEKKFQEIKEAQKKIVEGSLTIWNARLDALIEAGRAKDILDHISLTNICGCPEPGSPVCQCSCPPALDLNHSIYEMKNTIVELGKEIQELKKFIK